MTDEEVREWEKLPILDQLDHKHWKARKFGYENLDKKLKTCLEPSDYQKDPNHKPILNLLHKLLKDSNELMRIAASDVVLKFLDTITPVQGSKVFENCLKSILEKCLSSKPKLKENSFQIITKFFQYELKEGVSIFLETLYNDKFGYKAKQPKILAAVVELLHRQIENFGCPKLFSKKDISSICKNTAALAANKDKVVRENVKKLFVEMYLWEEKTVKALVNALPDLKDAQKKEFEKEFEKCDASKSSSKKKPKMKFKSEEDQETEPDDDMDVDSDVDQGQGPNSELEDNASESEEIDPYDILEPTEILKPISTWSHKDDNADPSKMNFEQAISSKNWKHRKEALDFVLGLLSAKELVKLDGRQNYSDIITPCNKIISKDTNVSLIPKAAEIIKKVAIGIRNNFQYYSLCTEDV